MKTLSILKNLVKIESLSGKEEKLAKYILAYLKKLGYDAFMEGLNVLVLPEKDFIVTTHLDTFKVLASFSFNKEYAYGTGVCDAKASITAILLALERIDKLNFGVAFFYDEEGEGKGSENFCKKYKPKKAIVMEPTSLTIANVQYGGIEVLIKVKGIAAHGATPGKGINAIEKCIEFVNELKKLEDTIASVQFINGGNEEDYIIPDSCIARIELLFKPHIRAEKVLQSIKQLCSNDISFVIKDIYDGFESKDTAKLIAKAVKSAGLKIKFSEMPSWNDAVNLYLNGCDPVIFGPGELFLCHTQNERIKLKDIELATRVLVILNKLV